MLSRTANREISLLSQKVRLETREEWRTIYVWSEGCSSEIPTLENSRLADGGQTRFAENILN